MSQQEYYPETTPYGEYGEYEYPANYSQPTDELQAGYASGAYSGMEKTSPLESVAPEFISMPYTSSVEFDPQSTPFNPSHTLPMASAPFDLPSTTAGLPFSSTGNVPFNPTALMPPAKSTGPDFYGKTKSWAASKGYGWLLEVEDDEDDDNQRPLLEELDINFFDIFLKVKAILLPYGLQPCDPKLTEPDFWGPFFIVLLYSCLLIWGQLRVVSWVFTLWLVGSFLLYFLARVLGGGESGFAVTLAVTGYSLIPLVLLAVLLPFASRLGLFCVALKVLHTLWCTYAAQRLMLSEALRGKQMLMTYPIGLFYAYFIALHSGV
eukprot:GGOE01019043.1.p1 GENE.GGOE01019043.1~~GGOE01019043.1.p1  ORF type:complete len:328 (+),score=98.20 GGOE01019043.1:24-986(+)